MSRLRATGLDGIGMVHPQEMHYDQTRLDGFGKPCSACIRYRACVMLVDHTIANLLIGVYQK
jgi:hypothetical protein